MKSAPPTRNDLKIADQKGRIALGSRHAGKRFSVREEEDGTTILTPVLVVPEKNYAPLLSMLDESFAALESLTGNWDGRGSPAPSPTLVRHAREMLALMQAGVISRGIPWDCSPYRFRRVRANYAGMVAECAFPDNLYSLGG